MKIELNPTRKSMLSIQVLPLSDDPIPIIDHAIETIAASGIQYRVQPMETLLEGTLDELFQLAQKAHLACFEAGAGHVVTIIKIADQFEGITSGELLTDQSERGI
jgi:uncharacterized protein YqgV (UPF0045/DUF77 family)